jgi:hypothetical protein
VGPRPGHRQSPALAPIRRRAGAGYVGCDGVERGRKEGPR